MADSAAVLEFLLPGDPLTITGGYEYDRRMVDGLRTLGWTVRVRTLDASFPFPTAESLADAQRQLAALPPDSLVLIDGLALGAMPETAKDHAKRLKLVGLVHHPLAAETGLTPQLAARLFESERAALQAMRMVLVTSHATRRALDDYDVPADRIAVIEPGVDKPSGALAEVSGESNVVRLLCVATITPRKGHDLLVAALAELRDRAWVLSCVGDTERSPETVAALRASIAAAGLEDRILLTGKVDASQLAELLRSSDLFVLATHFEGYGMAVAQALTHGLPIVSTRTGAIAELVSERAGLLVEPNDVAALREALARLIGDDDLRRRLARGARDAARNLPDWRMASELFSKALIDAAQRPLDPALRS